VSSEAPARPGQVIRLGYSEPGVNALLQGLAAGDCPREVRFNQNEELFVELPDEIEVPSFPIHHDVHQARPAAAYAAGLGRVVAGIARLAPGMLKDLAYTFDPGEVLKARFHRVYEIEGRPYLYMLKVDLAWRHQEHTVVARGTNDMTAAYRGRRLFVEPVVVPLDGPAEEAAAEAWIVHQSFSQTWLGQRGRGYFVQGIWIDHDLTKFFSRLFLPPDVHTYPYFPFVCRYRTICFAPLDLTPEGRVARLPSLQSALDYIAPVVGRIEREMRTAGFSEDLPLFQELRRGLAPEWQAFCREIRVKPYINPAGNKEFSVESING
jgi:hypothetical protein